MAQYFFKMTNEEKNNILNQHKTIYDGYVTEYGQQTNKQPLYVQDYANDKVGLVVSNKGVVKPYTNMGINESHSGLDMIGDNSEHLTNGTVDLDDYGFNSDNEEYPSPNEDEFEYISLGNINDDDGYDDYADEDYDDKFDKESQEIKRIDRELGERLYGNQSRIDNVNPFVLLDTLKGLSESQLSEVVTQIMNLYREKTSTLGYKIQVVEDTFESRNIAQ